MKRLTLLLLTIFSLTAYGQDTLKSKPTRDFKRILIGVNFSPDYCFRTLKNNDGSSSSTFVMNSRNDREIAKFGYTASLNLCFNFTEHIGLETGIQYSNKGYQTKMQDLFWGQPDPSLPTKAKFVYSDLYIDIPLKANFTFGKRKFKFCSSAGLTTNIFIKETSTSIQEFSNGDTKKQTSKTIFSYKRVDLSPRVSIGLDYKINNRMNLKVEPTFRYGVLKIIDTPVTGYLWNAGLNISYYFGLR